MPRSTNSSASRGRKKRVLRQTKGQFGNRSRLYRYAKEGLEHALQYAYRHRRTKKREWRNLWIVRLNAACRAAGMSYSRFMEGVKAAGVELDRKALSEMAIHSPEAFQSLVEKARAALEEKKRA